MKKIFIIAIVIRLICLYLFRNVANYDLESYLQVGQLTLSGFNIYPKIASLHHPYFPFFLYIEALAVYIGNPIIVIKSILTIFDLGILYLVYLLSNKNLKNALIYAINPVTILVTTLHGQFDVIPVFFILLSIYLFNKKNQLAGLLSFSFAILTKTWPVLFLIPFVRKVKNKKLLFIIIIMPVFVLIIYLALFKSNAIDIIKTIASYHGLWGIWGLWSLWGGWRLRWQILSTIMFLSSYFLYSYFNTEKNLAKNILLLLFFFFIFTTNFSIQYLTWIVPFLILSKPIKYLHLIVLISFYLFSFYYFWLFCLSCKSTPGWLIKIQNITGLLLWLSFIKKGYLSSKKSY